jgi:subtilisin-like proprotein convertase family protein
VNSGGATELTVTTTARTAPGAYRVLVVGSGPAATRAVRFTLTVVAPAGCVGANDSDAALPDSEIVEIPVTIAGCAGTGAVGSTVEVHVDHTYVGDLEAELIAPSGKRYHLLSQTGDDLDDIDYTFTHDLSAERADGTWKLYLLDNGPSGVGSFDSVVLDLAGEQLPPPACGGLSTTPVALPDSATVESPITVSGCDRPAGPGAYVEVHIVHPWERDLRVALITPDGRDVTLQEARPSGESNLIRTFIVGVSGPAGGVWKLRIENGSSGNPDGVLEGWRITL